MRMVGKVGARAKLTASVQSHCLASGRGFRRQYLPRLGRISSGGTTVLLFDQWLDGPMRVRLWCNVVRSYRHTSLWPHGDSAGHCLYAVGCDHTKFRGGRFVQRPTQYDSGYKIHSPHEVSHETS